LIFSEKEKEYIGTQIIARIATTDCSISMAGKNDNTDGVGGSQPDVVPVGFDFDGEYFYVSGKNILKSTKYKKVLKNNRVAIVVDDLETINPWKPRGIRIYGTADLINRQGGYMSYIDPSQSHYLRIKPLKKWSWGIDEPVFVEGKFNVKKSTTSI
jgi:pyridoxamine 5'-phosphate oxidase family protein